jgi:hypothetical protein
VLSIITADRNFYSLYGANENDLQLSRCLPAWPACNIITYLSAVSGVSLSPQRGAPIHYWHIFSRIKTAPETPLAMTCLASQMREREPVFVDVYQLTAQQQIQRRRSIPRAAGGR